MKSYLKLSVVIGVLALIVPAMALATPGNGKGQGQGPSYEPAPPPPPPPAKAYGKYCQGESKEHVKGEKGTAFSRCVKAAAKLRQDERKKAREEQQV